MRADQSLNDFMDAAADNEPAFEHLYDRLGARLLRVASTIAGSHADAEDAVQDVFVNLIKMGYARKAIQNLDAYLFTAVHRAAIACAKKGRREPPVDVRDEIVPAAAFIEDRPAELDRLQSAVHGLPEEQREIIALKIDGELTFEQIAEILRINANTAASRYRYALEKLRTAMTGTTTKMMLNQKGHEDGNA